MSEPVPPPPAESLKTRPRAPAAPVRTWIAVRNATIIAFGIALTCAAVSGVLDRSIITAAAAGASCFAPLASLLVMIALLTTVGVHAPSQCGYCGYDRVGLSPQVQCPECGRAFDPNAPGYVGFGRRTLPVSAWLPPLLWLFVVLLIPILRLEAKHGPALLLAWLAGLAVLMVHAGWRVWRPRA